MSLPEGAAEFVAADAAQQPSRSYRLDPETGRIVGTVDGLEAIKQFVYKALQTERFAHDIYTGRFGHDIPFTDAESAVEAALMADERIMSVDNFQAVRTGDELALSFAVHSVFGSFEGGVNLDV